MLIYKTHVNKAIATNKKLESDSSCNDFTGYQKYREKRERKSVIKSKMSRVLDKPK